MALESLDGPYVSDGLVAQVLAFPPVRPQAVARARALLESRAWCHAEEVANELVDCLVGRRVP